MTNPYGEENVSSEFGEDPELDSPDLEEEEENSQPRQQEKTLAPAQVVAGTSRSPSTASNRKVKLSQEDLLQE